ncbi:hypothetical protein GUJ93_ZPchr0006g43381 [Zizania palustris]|uniref:Uncharacterized protein n=1 Tax=Zizania palustris TaxID=103762 RepID=A0A8J5W3T1_ZIZPA|nr:hypothetical protein GUJ93_ZPchr0006g43381 [Zizania palustris]
MPMEVAIGNWPDPASVPSPPAALRPALLPPAATAKSRPLVTTVAGSGCVHASHHRSEPSSSSHRTTGLCFWPPAASALLRRAAQALPSTAVNRPGPRLTAKALRPPSSPPGGKSRRQAGAQHLISA